MQEMDMEGSANYEYSSSSRAALRRAEAVRIATNESEVTSEMLLYGLLAKRTGAAYCVLAALGGGDPHVVVAARFGWSSSYKEAERLPTTFTKNSRRILEIAAAMATARKVGGLRFVRDRHLFQAILGVPESVAHATLERILAPNVSLDRLREVLQGWSPNEDFTIASMRQRLGLVDASPSNHNGAATATTPAIATDERVQLRHGDLLSDASCDLIVLPISSIGSMRHWAAAVAADHKLKAPGRVSFGTVSAVQRSGDRGFVFAASVNADSLSSPDAIRNIGQALGRLQGYRRIAAPLLGAGMNAEGAERLPPRIAFAALRDGFSSVADSRAQLVVLIPDAKRLALLQGGAPGSTTSSPATSGLQALAASTVISGFRSDTIDDQDLLDIQSEVNALCSVIAAGDVTPPLSIGLFGDWGSGKSFFIDKMKARLDDMAAAARCAEERGEPAGYCSHITQLEFNAWRYIDTELWASLAEGILDGLARSLEESKDVTAEQRARLLAATARTRDVLEQAEQRRKQAVDELASHEQRLLRLVDQANAPLPSGPAIERAARELAIAKSAELRSRLDGVAKTLGTTAETSGAKAALLDLQGAFRNVRAAWLCFQSQPASHRLLRLALPIMVFVVATLATSTIEYGTAWLVKVATTLLMAAGAAAPLIKRARLATAEIGRLAKDYRDRVDSERKEQHKKLEGQRERARADVVQAEAQVRDARGELARLEEQIDALRADRVMAEFIRKRHASDDYRKHLGVIARARDDFEQLSKLLVRARTEERPRDNKTPLPRIDRIVLYIDDLDRCDEQQVVKVLQAVHLLLAFELFVVVVAVDPRWLLHSLRQHSKAFHSDSNETSEIPAAGGHWQSTPLNYLEKIFQIPFSLNPINKFGFGKMIDSLVEPLARRTEHGVNGAGVNATGAGPESSTAHPNGSSRVRAPEQSTAGNARRSDADTRHGDLTPPFAADQREPRAIAENAGTPGDSPPRVLSPRRPEIDVRPQHLKIGAAEQEFMKLLHAFVPSPRATKRFVNVYRLLRAGIAADRLAAFTGSSVTGEYQAALILLAVTTGFPEQAADLMHDLVDARPTGSWWAWWDDHLSTMRRAGLLGTRRQSWEDLAACLADLKSQLDRKAMQLPECNVFRFWAPRIARFSFESGRLGIVPEIADGPPAPSPTPIAPPAAGAESRPAVVQSPPVR
jgi:hypothetical protein